MLLTEQFIDKLAHDAKTISKKMEIDVATVLDLCADAKAAHSAAREILTQALHAGMPNAHASYATVEGIGRLLGDKQRALESLSSGLKDAEKRATDAEAAARFAIRGRTDLEQDLALALRLVEEVGPEALTGLDPLKTMTLSSFSYYRAILTQRYRELKVDGAWKDGRADQVPPETTPIPEQDEEGPAF